MNFLGSFDRVVLNGVERAVNERVRLAVHCREHILFGAVGAKLVDYRFHFLIHGIHMLDGGNLAVGELFTVGYGVEHGLRAVAHFVHEGSHILGELGVYGQSFKHDFSHFALDCNVGEQANLFVLGVGYAGFGKVGVQIVHD